jgi:putative transposase
MAFWNLDYHLIWATKLRQPLLMPHIENAVFDFLRTQAENMKCAVYAVNGWVDHVHMVLSIPPTLSVVEVVKQVKGASSHKFFELYWQDGYGALTVGRRNLDIAIAYVCRQKEHHSAQTALKWLERCEEDAHAAREQKARKLC